jgi:adenylate cyclase
MHGVTVDFEAEGLLKGTRGNARQARLELLEELLAEGFSLEELREAVAEDRLALLPVERVLAPEGQRFSGREVAQQTGLPVDFLITQRQALGLPVPDPDDPVFDEEDVEAAGRLRAFRDAGFPDDALLDMARVLGMAMSQVAAANRSLVADVLVHEGDTERDVGLRFAEIARTLGPLSGESLSYILNLHLREQVRNDVIGRAELTVGSPGAQEITACFADLVGFTELGEALAPEDLGGVTGRLGRLVGEVATTPVRLVKMIGDAAMLVSPDAEAIVEAALTLVDAARAEEELPMLRAGVAHGPAIARVGDWYGRPINLASRITGIARPGSVVLDQSAKEAAGDRYSYSFAGERRLKGIHGRVTLFRARREHADAPARGSRKRRS